MIWDSSGRWIDGGNKTPRNDKMWRKKYEQLLQYRRENGTCHVPSDFDDDKLLSWTKTQRKEYRRAVRGERLALTPERWNCSIRLTFEMTAVHEDSWQVRIRELKGDVNHLGFVWNQWDVLNVLGLVWNR